MYPTLKQLNWPAIEAEIKDFWERENVFEKLGHLEALDGFDKDGNEWSVESGKDMREDEDYLHDN
jgi:hypothetical protein